MTTSLIDTNIFIDLLGPATPQRLWSVTALEFCMTLGGLIVSPIVWAELAASPLSETQIVAAFSWLPLRREALPFEAAFTAGKAHRAYRLAGGQRERTLPDFLIGAHALHAQHRLLTRDAVRYKTYFPGVELVCPQTFPVSEAP